MRCLIEGGAYPGAALIRGNTAFAISTWFPIRHLVCPLNSAEALSSVLFGEPEYPGELGNKQRSCIIWGWGNGSPPMDFITRGSVPHTDLFLRNYNQNYCFFSLVLYQLLVLMFCVSPRLIVATQKFVSFIFFFCFLRFWSICPSFSRLIDLHTAHDQKQHQRTGA